MSNKYTKIEWTDKTWNPVAGCTKISEGCKNCYAEKIANRLQHISSTENYKFCLTDKKWNGHITLGDLEKPKKWKKPMMIFVCSMGDLFHENVEFRWLEKIWETICSTPRHTYQILTKRPQRILEFYKYLGEKIKKSGLDSVPSNSDNALDYIDTPKHVWIGISVENQKAANERIPILLEIPAKVRFLSCEPLLEEIDLSRFLPECYEGIHPDKGKTLYPKYFMVTCDNCGWIGSSGHLDGGEPIADTGDYNDCYCPSCGANEYKWKEDSSKKINWVIAGPETGIKARPMKYEWIFSLYKQCKISGTAFFDKKNILGKNVQEFPIIH